jgi:hypothetical protein
MVPPNSVQPHLQVDVMLAETLHGAIYDVDRVASNHCYNCLN